MPRIRIIEEIQEFVQRDILAPVKTRTDRVHRYLYSIVIILLILFEALYFSGQWVWLGPGLIGTVLLIRIVERRLIRPGYGRETQAHCRSIERLKLK
jgi:hypothetical protein